MKYLTNFLLFCLLLPLGASCIHEEPYVYGGENDLVLRVQTEWGYDARATEPGQDVYNENKVDAISILFYLDGQLKWQVKSTDYQIHEGTYIIPVKEEMRPFFNGSNNFHIYVVANLDFVAPTPETDLPKYVVNKSIEVSTTVNPADFVMLAQGEKIISMSTTEGKQLGDFKLKRVAAKIRIMKPTINIEGYEVVGDVQAKLRNWVTAGFLATDATAIADGALHKTTDYLPITESTPVQSAHFYSYYNRWSSSDLEKRPEFFLMVKLKQTGADDSAAKVYYYRVPIEAVDDQIKSNFLYNLNVAIHVLGSLEEPEAVAVNGMLAIEDWTVHEDSFNLPATHYLIVEQDLVYMNNISTYSLNYQSSLKPINIAIQSVTFSYVSSDGTQHNDPVQSGDPQYPTVDKNETAITIESKIPTNNVPKKIIFEVTNGVPGLKRTVTVFQYPAQYIVNTWGTASAWRPDGTLAQGLNNKAIYHVVVLVPPEDLFGDGTQAFIGYPSTQSVDFYSRGGIWPYTYTHVWSDEHATKDNLETSKMISPSFELASQLGATLPMPYRVYWNDTEYLRDYSTNANNDRYALFNCAYYYEKRVVNGVVQELNDWRLPTEAEIKLIDRLQRGNSAVQEIMTGNYYWDAYSTNGAYRMQEGGGQGTSSDAYVRCVRDVKDDIRGKNKLKNLK